MEGKIIESALEQMKNFVIDFKDENKLSDFLSLIKQISKDECFAEDKKNVLCEYNTEEDRVIFVYRKIIYWLLKMSPEWKDEIQKEECSDVDNESITIRGQMEEYIYRGVAFQYEKGMTLYYKNFLSKDLQKKFEQMLDFIGNELCSYNMNLVYTKKILDYLEEFKIKGIYPAQNIFLYQYLNTSTAEMILILTKLFAKESYKRRNNIGFGYIKEFLLRNTQNQEVNSIIRDNIANLLIEGENLTSDLNKKRDSYIAHYDNLNKMKKSLLIPVTYEKLENLFNLETQILEKISFSYFERKNLAYRKLIQAQGFQKAVCGSFFVSNDKCDLDLYLDLLRSIFKGVNKDVMS